MVPVACAAGKGSVIMTALSMSRSTLSADGSATSAHESMPVQPAEGDSSAKHVTSFALRQGMKIGLVIVATFAISATLVSLLVLGQTLAAIGAFTAFSLMLFIGMPLILASIGDSMESGQAHGVSA
jgi:hypothetical protein